MTVGRSGPRSRRGFMVVVAMVCVAVVMLMAVASLRLLARERQSLRAQAWELQASALADAAIQRAGAILATQADYAGETWRVAAEQIDGKHPAVVRIAVEAVADRPGERRVRVVADYPDDPMFRARRSLETVLVVGSP